MGGAVRPDIEETRRRRCGRRRAPDHGGSPQPQRGARRAAGASSAALAGFGGTRSFDLRGTARAMLEQVGGRLRHPASVRGRLPGSGCRVHVSHERLGHAAGVSRAGDHHQFVPGAGESEAGDGVPGYHPAPQRQTHLWRRPKFRFPSASRCRRRRKWSRRCNRYCKSAGSPWIRAAAWCFCAISPARSWPPGEILTNLSRKRAQVNIEVELLSVSNNSTLTYGLQLQNMAPVLNFGTFLHNVPCGPSPASRASPRSAAERRSWESASPTPPHSPR